MKIITASNGKKTVKMSKSEWMAIGKQAGWNKSVKLASETKTFPDKKQAIVYLKEHGLESVGWKEGDKDKVAIYWNGKICIEDADTKKRWASTNKKAEWMGSANEDSAPMNIPAQNNEELLRLKNEAEESCSYHGHTLGEWEDFKNNNGLASSNSCKSCGKNVQVMTNPQPNQIGIGGPAVALDCGD